mgnify:CR=1 FL=1
MHKLPNKEYKKKRGGKEEQEIHIFLFEMLFFANEIKLN